MMRQRPYGIISWDKQAVIAEQKTYFQIIHYGLYVELNWYDWTKGSEGITWWK